MGNALFWSGNSAVLFNLSFAHHFYVYSIFSSFPVLVAEFSSVLFCVNHSFYVLLFFWLVWLSWVISITSGEISSCLGMQAFFRGCSFPGVTRSTYWELELCYKKFEGRQAVQWKKVRGRRSCFTNHPLNFCVVWCWKCHSVPQNCHKIGIRIIVC